MAVFFYFPYFGIDGSSWIMPYQETFGTKSQSFLKEIEIKREIEKVQRL
jgi:hypothetical protein